MTPNIVKQRPGEHGTDTLRRLLTGLKIPHSVKRGLFQVVNSLELTKSQLKGHVTERKEQIKSQQEHAAHQSDAHARELYILRVEHGREVKSLQNELDQARRAYSGDDDLVKLYHAGTAILTKQAAEIKELQATRLHGKKDLERHQRMIEEKESEKAELVKTVERLRNRLSSLTTEFMDAEKDLERQLVDTKEQLKAAAARSSKLQGDILIANNVIDDLRRREATEGRNADLLERLRKVEQHCEGYRSTATDQQKLIEKLSNENAKLMGALGRQHFLQDS